MGAIRLLHPWPEALERTQELMLKYERMDAADASLVVLSEIHAEAQIITTDRRDFRVYRRWSAEAAGAVSSRLIPFEMERKSEDTPTLTPLNLMNRRDGKWRRPRMAQRSIAAPRQARDPEYGRG